MAVTEDDIAFVYDLFGSLGGLTHRKMMGGLSIYSDGQIFAILSAEGQVYLKAAGDFAKELAAEGSVKFEMENDRSMHYWTLPEAALDDPQEACAWARRALEAL